MDRHSRRFDEMKDGVVMKSRCVAASKLIGSGKWNEASMCAYMSVSRNGIVTSMYMITRSVTESDRQR